MNRTVMKVGGVTVSGAYDRVDQANSPLDRNDFRGRVAKDRWIKWDEVE